MDWGERGELGDGSELHGMGGLGCELHELGSWG